MVIVLSDGLTKDDDKSTLSKYSALLKSLANKVIAVGVEGKKYNDKLKLKQRAELEEIASSKDDLFLKPSYQKLKDHLDPIAQRACPVNFK